MKQLSIFKDALTVKRAHGKSLLRQATEILGFKRRNPTLGATDYFTCRLYDPEHTAAARAEDFLGWRAQEDLALALNQRAGVMPAWDKFTFALIAHAFNLPVPALRALYRPGPAPANGVAEIALDSPDCLADWLRTQNCWPLFAKPSYGQGGLDCHCLTGFHAAEDALLTRRGEKIPVMPFVSRITGHDSVPHIRREMGYLFQEVLRPHPQIAELLGNDAISGVRLVIAQDERGAEPVTAFWKIIAGDNDIDNIHGFTTGNLTGEIALESGRLGRVLNGYWPNASIIARSPRTQRSFGQFVLPHWPEVLALCTSAAPLFPLIRMQCWDIAITGNGPCIVELNEMPDVAIMQLWGRGILTPRMRALLRRHGNTDRYPWLKKLITPDFE